MIIFSLIILRKVEKVENFGSSHSKKEKTGKIKKNSIFEVTPFFSNELHGAIYMGENYQLCTAAMSKTTPLRLWILISLFS